MPYTLDLIRHRDQFRRRGLKPVHNPEANPPDREADQQYQADDDEAEIDKDERYLPPKDGQERAPKRRRVQAEENNVEDTGVQVKLPAGRKKFLDPPGLDVDNIRKTRLQESPKRQVYSNVMVTYISHQFSISLLTMIPWFFHQRYLLGSVTRSVHSFRDKQSPLSVTLQLHIRETPHLSLLLTRRDRYSSYPTATTLTDHSHRYE
jgi:hypothetical protein